MPEPSLTFLAGAAKAGLPVVLPHLMNPLTRRNTLVHFRRELRETTGSEAQTEYLYTLFADHPVLSRISTLTSADDVLGMVSGMLVGHPRFEQILVTRALLMALGIATANSTYQRLMITMQLDQYLATKVGAFRELMAEVRRRAALPGTAARADLARRFWQLNLP